MQTHVGLDAVDGERVALRGTARGALGESLLPAEAGLDLSLH